jgi:hypothetical protein
MTLRVVVFRLCTWAILVATSGCLSPPHNRPVQYDHLGRPVPATSQLVIHAEEGAITFSLPHGWLVLQQPDEYERRAYVLSRNTPTYGQPTISVGTVADKRSLTSSSPDKVIEERLHRQLQDNPHAGWQRIGEATTATGRRVPLYVAVGFPAGGWLVTAIPEDGFFTWIDLDAGGDHFDEMMSVRGSFIELISSYKPFPTHLTRR